MLPAHHSPIIRHFIARLSRSPTARVCVSLRNRIQVCCMQVLANKQLHTHTCIPTPNYINTAIYTMHEENRELYAHCRSAAESFVTWRSNVTQFLYCHMSNKIAFSEYRYIIENYAFFASVNPRERFFALIIYFHGILQIERVMWRV